ncbi:hypothetical protein C3L33_01095, partial [Rhododendron williamsianum]
PPYCSSPPAAILSTPSSSSFTAIPDMKDVNGSPATTVCVTGAAGFIGSWLIMRLLERGYVVRATVRDPVKRLVFTSSAGTVNVQEHQQPVYDENNWSDLDFINEKKMTGWMYFVSKTLAEKAAWEAAKENNIDFISVIPVLVVGPFIMPTFPPSLVTALSPITGSFFNTKMNISHSFPRS